MDPNNPLMAALMGGGMGGGMAGPAPGYPAAPAPPGIEEMMEQFPGASPEALMALASLGQDPLAAAGASRGGQPQMPDVVRLLMGMGLMPPASAAGMGQMGMPGGGMPPGMGMGMPGMTPPAGPGGSY